jgi:hypothetical protein
MTNSTNTIKGLRAIDYAEAHGLTLCKYADPAEGARSGLSVEEAREVAREDASLIWLDGIVPCHCGEWSGTRCQWTGPKSETVVVEWMPEHLRSSHQTAGNRGSYPANGAERIHVACECADEMIDADGDWCAVIGATS